jgi:hypothetical protein
MGLTPVPARNANAAEYRLMNIRLLSRDRAVQTVPDNYRYLEPGHAMLVS